MCYSPVSPKEWELYDCNCALVLSTNALETLGFWIMHPNGELVNRTWKERKEMTQQTAVSELISDNLILVHVILNKKLPLGPFQSKVVMACTLANCAIHIGVITPIDKLANMQCDFAEKL